MDNKSEKRTDNLGRMKAMDYRDMAAFLCSQGWQLGDETQCEEWLDLNMVLMVSYDAHKQ